jgi:hypothetical protein
MIPDRAFPNPCFPRQFCKVASLLQLVEAKFCALRSAELVFGPHFLDFLSFGRKKPLFWRVLPPKTKILLKIWPVFAKIFLV